MRQGLLLLIFLFSIQFSSAQQGTYGRGAPAIGKVSGQIVDAISKKPVDFATVSLMRVQDQGVETGAIANEKGFFVLEHVKAGRYLAKVSFIGYDAYTSDTILITPDRPEVYMGVVRIKPSAKMLNEVQVTGEKSMMQMAIDKKVFNVDKNLMSEGGTANDVLQNIPSISLDINNNVSLRGSANVTVLIDGKPSSLTGADRAAILDQIPAGNIESVELITNPSAKYDPDGTSGIINIVLKKNKQENFNGTVNATAGTGDRYSTALTLNYRKDKWNLSSSISARSNRNVGTQRNLRKNMFSDTTFYVNQRAENRNLNQAVVAKLGVDYIISKNNTAGISGTYNIGSRNGRSTINYESLDEMRNVESLSRRNSESKETNNSTDLSAYYKHAFARPKEELNLEGTYSFSNGGPFEKYTQQALNTDGSVSAFPPDLQSNDRTDAFNISTIKLDYTRPVTEFSKIEAGYKSSFRNVDGDLRAEFFDNGTSVWMPDSLLSNRFIFEEKIHAVYGTYSQQIRKFGFQVGLRAEQAYNTIDQRTQNEKYENNYFSLFPSAYLSQKLTQNQELQLNYSRRINRPPQSQLNPFVDYGDPQNLRKGNPKLNPEYIDSYEFSYVRYWAKGSLTSTVYFRQINGTIQRFRTVDSAGVSTVTFANLNKSQNTGFEFIATNELRKGWNLTSNLNLFRSRIDGTNLGGELKNAPFNWSARVTSFTRIPKWFDVQVSGNYNSPMQSVQGKSLPMYSMDLGLKKDILKSKGTLNLSLSDIFDTRAWNFDSYGPSFEQESRFKRQSRVLTLGLTYRFGKSDLSTQRKRSRQDDNMNRDYDSGGDMF